MMEGMRREEHWALGADGDSGADGLIRRIHREQMGLRKDLAALRTDLADGIATMHTRFAVVHQDMTRVLELLRGLERERDGQA